MALSALIPAVSWATPVFTAAWLPPMTAELMQLGAGRRQRGRQRRRYQQAVGVFQIVGAIGKIVAQLQFLIGVIAADQPVEAAAKGFALDAQFLGEGLEAVERGAVVIAEQDVEIVEVGVLAADVFVVAIGRDRGQLGAAEVIDDLARQAVILDVRAIRAARRDRDVARKGVVADERAKRALEAGDGRRLFARGGIVARRQDRSPTQHSSSRFE